MSVASFKARFTEFEDQSDEQVALRLDDAALQLDEARWGKFYPLGLSYLAAHLLALRLQETAAAGEGASSAGPIYSETVGPLNFKRAVLPMSADGGTALLASTSYGLRYLELLKLVRPVGYMVVTDASFNLASFGI
jgi:hypothetical protein